MTIKEGFTSNELVGKLRQDFDEIKFYSKLGSSSLLFLFIDRILQENLWFTFIISYVMINLVDYLLETRQLKNLISIFFFSLYFHVFCCLLSSA